MNIFRLFIVSGGGAVKVELLDLTGNVFNHPAGHITKMGHPKTTKIYEIDNAIS
jgi:hypothetical protein